MSVGYPQETETVVWVIFAMVLFSQFTQNVIARKKNSAKNTLCISWLYTLGLGVGTVTVLLVGKYYYILSCHYCLQTQRVVLKSGFLFENSKCGKIRIARIVLKLKCTEN